MSKMDGLRAMREARYAEAEARARQGTAAPKRPPTATAGRTAPVPAPETAASTEGLCGHPAISGRTCTREQGHAAKSHRYS
jgi:hypothetical protein